MEPVHFPTASLELKGDGVKHIDLDAQNEQVKQFVLSLDLDPDGSLLELHGEPVAHVFPAIGSDLDREKLKQAILSRRDESRTLNADWEHADREVWDRASTDE